MTCTVILPIFGKISFMADTKTIPTKALKKIPSVNNNLDVYWYIKNNTIDGRYLLYFNNPVLMMTPFQNGLI